MANIPGASNVNPGAFSSVTTQSRGVSVPGGTRILAILGEGARSEVIVSAGLGGGKDGFNSTYTSSNGADGRHFLLKNAGLISNRTTLYRNGIPLVGLEEAPGNDNFSHAYDYRIDITTGQIELQKAALVDLGGKFYTTGSSNVGLGNLDGYEITLLDENAPTETWTIKCVSVQRNSMNQPIQETARFIAVGSVSGQKLDANGNPIIWVSNGQLVDNGVLQFAISETQAMMISTSPFREGDFFTIKVTSGVIKKNDALTATYISSLDLNDPVFFTDASELNAKHGFPSLDNTLSLAADLAFANSPPGVLALQTAPALPRRTSYDLLSAFDADSTTLDDFVLPFPIGVVPDADSNIHFFVTDPTTGVETQLLPNKFTYYTLDTMGQPTTNDFVFDDTNPPSGNSFSYSVNTSYAALNSGSDGYLNRDESSTTLATFSVSGTTFDSTYIGKMLKIFDATNLADNGTFLVTDVVNGKLVVDAYEEIAGIHTSPPPFDVFVSEIGVTFELIDAVTGATIPLSSETDGVLTDTAGQLTTGLFTSMLIDFNTFPLLLTYRLKITNAANGSNIGTFDILSYDSGPNELTIAKAFVSESNLQYEVLDQDSTSAYLVINHNIVPDGNDLRVTIVDARDADFYDSGWTTALETMETVECDILTVFPKQTISVIIQNALNHCITMSSTRNRKERVLFTGAIKGLTPDNVLGNKDAAVEDIGVLEGIQGDSVAEILASNIEDLTNYSVVDSFGHTYRAVYFYPDSIVAQVGSDNVELDGFYVAAAAGGLVSGTSYIGMPLTNKVVSGFTILRSKQYNQTTLENLSAAGITTLQPVAGGGRVVWGKTTTQSGFPEEEEISIVFIRDRVAKSMRRGFEGFVGQPEDNDTSGVLTARANGLLKSFISQKLITNFADLNVVRDSVEPRQWNVSCRVQPVYSINWIYLQIGVGLI